VTSTDAPPQPTPAGGPRVTPSRTPLASPPVTPPSTGTGPTVRSTVARFRGPVLVAAALALAGALVGLLSAAGSGGTLDPSSYAPSGSRAVAELLGDRGVEVRRVGTVDAAQAAAGQGSVLVLPSPGALTLDELEQLAGAAPQLVLVAPQDDALEALGVPARIGGDADVEGRRPACDLPAAVRAGEADAGGLLYDPTAGDAVGCYATSGSAAVLDVDGAVLLGTGDPLTNDRLDERGNAALALGLLGTADRVVWLVPDPARDAVGQAPRSLDELLPDRLVLASAQLLVALAVLALWRARRLGRVVEEPLPVVVRAAEAVEGRSRLYRAAAARGSAADALRAGVRERAGRRLGLPPSVDRTALVATTAARTGRDPGTLDVLLYGPAPADDAALVRLADDLRALERTLIRPAPDREVAGP
jgi:hypothetical protein